MRMKPLEWVVVAAVMLACGALLYALMVRPTSLWQDRVRATLTLTEAAAMQQLGKPQFVISKSDDLAEEFDGYEPQPKWPVKARVLVYTHANWRGYLFINEQGVVEHVAFANT